MRLTSRIAEVDVFPVRLPFRAFSIARGSVGSGGLAPHVYVRVTADSGSVGWGEARPSHRWSYETEESVVSTLRGYLGPAVIGMEVHDTRRLHAAMDHEIAPSAQRGMPIAKAALDIAVHDLRARMLGVTLRQLFGGPSEARVALSWLVAESTPEDAATQASAGISRGYGAYKVKIGLAPSRDLDILRAVRAVVGDAYLWADANQAYDVPSALALARKAEHVPVDVLEQPVPAHDAMGLARLVRGSGVPIAVDESAFTPEDLIQLIRMDALDAVVVKVAKSGGLHGAGLMCAIARSAGIPVLGSGLTESQVGFSAAVQLLSAHGIEGPADLNGPQFLDADPVASGTAIEDGAAQPDARPGHGCTPDPVALSRFAAMPE